MKKGPLVIRTPEMDAKYRALRSALPEGDYDPFEERLAKEEPVRNFEYWALFENVFPYDAVADVHHVLVSKRKFARPGDMTTEERAELDALKLGLTEEYDAFIENFPRIQSVPSRLHFHFVVWKRRAE